MQSIKPGTFKNKLRFELFLDAHNRAKKTKGQKYEILEFERKLEVNLCNIINDIKNKKYHVGKYRSFTIYEPKERLIMSLPYKDRIVHQWYVNEFIIPYFCPRFINDSYACIKNKGTHKASYKLRKMIKSKNNQKFYFIKGDIKKYFYNIDKNILFNIFKDKCKDKDLLLFDNDSSGVSLPIGNYTSQYFANIYLNELDYYIKYDLNVKSYLRYMDDFILLINNKTEAKNILEKIRLFLNNNLKLELNHKSRIIPNYLGIDFVGYKIKDNIVLVRKNCILKMDKKLKNFNKEKVQESFNSFVAHAKHSNSNHLIKIFKLKYQLK